MSVLTVSEVFGPTIQGEGTHIGKPTIFVRLGGCEYCCSWCDTLYAVLPAYKQTWKKCSSEEVWQQVQALSPVPILVTLSGGNPAIQPLGPLIDLGHAHGYTFTMETQGSIDRAYFPRLDSLTLSPKPPSSGMNTRWDRLDRCVKSNPSATLKIVIFTEEDYSYAHRVAELYPTIPLYLQAGNETVGAFDFDRVKKKFEWLVTLVIKEQWNRVTVLPQLHTWIWGNTRGV